MSDMTYQETVNLFESSGYELTIMGEGESLLAICPAMGGRVVAATVSGPSGHNPFFVNPVDVKGGVEAEKLIFRGGLGARDWLGPEGCGDMSFYFRKKPVVMENWYVDERQSIPAMKVQKATAGQVTTVGEIHMPNLRGNEFDIEMQQAMRLVGDPKAALGAEVPGGVKYLGFTRGTSYKNIGSATWSEDYGFCMIWFLLMLRGSDNMFIIAPFKDGLGDEVIDYRFDDRDISADRLMVRREGGYVLYRGDGLERGKIGMVPQRAAGVLYGLDLDRGYLTVLRYPVDTQADYMNNLWTEEANSTGGDVVDAYNNKFDEEALPGRFCEMEAVSPRLALGPGESAAFETTTGFFQGPVESLKGIIKATSGCDLGNETFRA
ncbi:MAG: hypothetical protein JW936_01370 [Sedimentisphaerales bacterium]|nr:hypothetical protein [Sedimentisphaerales bacterium]